MLHIFKVYRNADKTNLYNDTETEYPAEADTTLIQIRKNIKTGCAFTMHPALFISCYFTYPRSHRPSPVWQGDPIRCPV